MRFMNFNFKLNLKVSAFYLEKQKSFIPKKNIFWAVPPRYIQKMALAVSIFQKVLGKTKVKLLFLAILQDPVKKHSSPVVVAQPRPREAVARRPRQ